MITLEQILSYDPCRSEEYLSGIYPITLHKMVYQERKAGRYRDLVDRLWALGNLAGVDTIRRVIKGRRGRDYRRCRRWLRDGDPATAMIVLENFPADIRRVYEEVRDGLS